MIVAFTTDKQADKAGIFLTKLFGEWIEEMTESNKRIEILNVSSSSSTKGWMMVVQYRILEEKSLE
jgi:hypothetical protein